MNPRAIFAEVKDTVRFLLQAFAIYLVFTTFAFAQYVIPSESMVPHLEVGDRVLVSKYAYGYSRFALPFDAGKLLPSGPGRLFNHTPKRGDVAVFIHPVSGDTLIKRVVGLPGDTIEVRAGAVIINGEAAPTTAPDMIRRLAHTGQLEEAARRIESLPDGYRHATHDLTPLGDLDNFGPYQVPAGFLFMMGDNRDNSLDSRWAGMGPVPIENLIGRAEVVHFVIPGCPREELAACPMPRWMKPLHL